MARKHSEETKQKIRLARARQKVNSMTGKKHSEETRKKMSLAHLGKQRSAYPWYVGAKVYHHRRGAEKREISWELTLEEACQLVQQDCVYCGIASTPVTSSAPGWSLIGVNGIDRLDSSLGYTKNNCVTSCGTCNIAKAQMSVDAFYEWIRRVSDKLAHR